MTRLMDATITERGSLVYTCSSCGRDHYHGAADAVARQVTRRVSHCPDDDGGEVVLFVVADARKAAA